ncbi:oleosin 21.2 kDa-like [Brassica napus]|uniref:Oleosin n=1 Tax=Brassica napus TaxID=3708 RepID=C3S7F4_BRANA|nr:oleosin 21.2 kDa-like [Brassica napus]ACG69509.1 oleosin S4-3 [Brassica napus]
MADTHRVDRTDRHLQFQPPYEGGRVNIQFEGAGEGYGQSGYGGGGGYGQSGYGGGGYKSMMPESGPSSTQVISFLVGVPIVGSLLAIAGLLLAGSVIGLMISIPLFLLFSPVIVPAAITIGLATTGFLASGMFGLTGLSSISWVMNYLRRTRGGVPDQLEYAKRRMADAVGYAGQKGKEMGQFVQDKAHDAKQYDISKPQDTTTTTTTTTKGHETRTAAA